MLPHEYAARTPERLHQAYLEWFKMTIWSPPDKPKEQRLLPPKDHYTDEELKFVSDYSKSMLKAKLGVTDAG